MKRIVLLTAALGLPLPLARAAETPAISLDAMPVIRVRHADGASTMDLKSSGKPATTAEKDGTVTTETFKDATHPLTVRVCRKSYVASMAVEQWVEIVNNETGPVVLERVESSAPVLRSPQGHWLKHYRGSWANELNPVEAKVENPVSISTARGSRVSEEVPPFFFLSTGGPASEDMRDALRDWQRLAIARFAFGPPRP